jgi:cytoskeleton protein RodZ
MSEQEVANDRLIDSTGVPRYPNGAGAMLRAAREAQGLHIAMLSVSLKVPIRKLEALESERFDLLPDMVFVRALAGSVCRALRIDADPVLSALPPSLQTQIKTDKTGLNTAFDDATAIGGDSWKGHLRKPLSLIFVFVVLGILAVGFVPDEWIGKHLQVAKIDNGPQTLAVVKANAVETIRVAAPSELPRSSSTPSSTPDAAKPVETGRGGFDVASEPVLPSAQAAPEPTAGVSDGILELRAQGETWVEVVDAKGNMKLRKILNKGEVVPVEGALPLAVVLGRADVVTVFVRGKPIDVSSLTKENVARFEVK